MVCCMDGFDAYGEPLSFSKTDDVLALAVEVVSGAINFFRLLYCSYLEFINEKR